MWECLPFPQERHTGFRPQNIISKKVGTHCSRLFQRHGPDLTIGGIALQHFADAILH